MPDATHDLKVFPLRELDAAKAHAMAGGQALHLMPASFAHMRADTPECFKRGGDIAHLFDQNRERLILTAWQLRIRCPKVERAGEPGQHIDLCGKPLVRALALAEPKPAPQPTLFD